MRQKFKNNLKIFTLLSLGLCVLFYFIGVMNLDNDGVVFGIIALIATPFILFGLAIAWTVFSTYPSLVNPLKARSAIVSKSNKNNKKQANEAKYAIVPLASITIFVFGAFLVLWFIMRGGPNEGMSSHLLGDENDRYLDVQIGVICLTVGCLLSAVNKLFSK